MDSLFSPTEISGVPLKERYPWMKDKKFVCVEKAEEVKTIVDEAIKSGLCAVDTETSGLDTRFYDGKCNTFLAGICLSYDGITGYYIPINHGRMDDGEYIRDASVCVDIEDIREDIQRLLNNCVCVYHNCIFDQDILEGAGFKIPEFLETDKQIPVKVGKKVLGIRKLAWEDTWCLAYLWDCTLKRKGLKFLSDLLLNMPMIELKDLFKDSKGKQKGPIMFYLLDPKSEECTAYACSDAICTFLLYKFFEEKKVKQQQAFIYYVELRAAMSTKLIYRSHTRLDIPKIKEYKARLISMLKEVENEAISLLKREINLSSPTQVAEALINDFKIDVVMRDQNGLAMKTDSGKPRYETGEEVLEKYSDQCPFVQLVLLHRGIVKTVSTYLDNLLNNADKNDEVRFKFLQWHVETGRFSCSGGGDGDGFSGVNIQAATKALKEKDKKDPKTGIPYTFEQIVRLKGSGFFLRSCLVARPGRKLVAIDYSGQELRVATNISNERIWVKEFLEGDGDLHTQTAKVVFKTNEPDASMREKSKTTNFQTIYGGGATALAGALKISIDEAKDFQQKLLGSLKSLKSWMEKTKKLAHKNKYAETPLGRRRNLEAMITSIDRGEQAKAERIAINTPVQGCGGDMMKLAMALCRDYITSLPNPDEVRMLLTVHDELVFEIVDEKMDEHIPALMNIMSLETVLHGCLGWEVPLSMDCEVGNSWEVEYEYFKKKPEMLAKLNPILKGAKCRAMGYDPNTLQPKNKPVTQPTQSPQPSISQTTVSVKEMVFEPKTQTFEAEESVVEYSYGEQSEDKPLIFNNNGARVHKSELEVINSDNFNTDALNKSLEAFLISCDDKSEEISKKVGVDVQEAFYIGLSVYVRTINNQIIPKKKELEGREIMNSILKLPDNYRHFRYRLSGEWTELKRIQVYNLLNYCGGGVTSYDIEHSNGTVFTSGKGLNAFLFQVLADYHNL